MRYKSEQYSVQTNDTRSLGNGGSISFLPEKGPRGGRNCLTRLIVKCDLSVTTNGATTIQTANLANVLKRFRLYDAQGDLINLTGPEVRLLHILESGRGALSDAADVAISQTGLARTIYFVIDFAPRMRARRRWDFALPVGALQRGGGIEFTSCSGADLGTGGGTTIVSQTFTFYANCREEFGVERHVRRELRSATQSQANDLYLPVNGGLLRSATLFKQADHDTGGTAQDATAVTIEAFGWQRIEPALLQREFMLEGDHDSASTQDPYVQSSPRAIPLVWPKADEKIPEMQTAAGQVLVRLEGSTVTSNTIVYDLITKATDNSTIADRAWVGGQFNKSQKTYSKSKKDPAAWGALANYMPQRFHKV